MNVYHWRDGSDLSGSAGALITILDEILVTGEGWTKAYSGTNKAAYTNGSGKYFRFDDSGQDATPSYREARMQLFATMSDVDTGTLGTPGTSSYYYVRKSNALTSDFREYIAFADDLTCHLFVRTGDQFSTTKRWSCISFGDYYAYHDPGDFSNAYVSGQSTSNNPGSFSQPFKVNTTIASGIIAGIASDGRSDASATVTSLGTYSQAGVWRTVGASGGLGLLYPDGNLEQVIADRIYVYDTTGPEYVVRGHLRGVFRTPNLMEECPNMSISAGAAGTAFDGKEFYVFHDHMHAANFPILIESTWTANA